MIHNPPPDPHIANYPGSRAHQMFPVLNSAQIETTKLFAMGGVQHFAPGQVVSEVGERFSPARLVIDGEIEVIRRDGIEESAAITTLRDDVALPHRTHPVPS